METGFRAYRHCRTNSFDRKCENQFKPLLKDPSSYRYDNGNVIVGASNIDAGDLQGGKQPWRHGH